jgi:hypothetical protein
VLDLGPASVGGRLAIGAWGSGPGQFGRKEANESNPEAPMALHAAPDGSLLVLDQVNSRVQRWKDGALVGSVPVHGDTAQDLAVLPNGAIALLDRLADRSVQIYSADGKLQNELTLEGPHVPEGGGVTALFADEGGIFVEREHGTVVRIADATGKADPARPEWVGRPSRDGVTLLSAAIADRKSGTILVRAFDRKTQAPRWSSIASMGAPLLHILTLEGDRQGRVYLAGAVGHESPAPPYELVDEQLVVVRLSPAGQQDGLLTLPPLSGPDETFRPVIVTDDGAVLVEQAGADGLEVRRYPFP